MSQPPKLEILAPLRTAIIAESFITSRLGSYQDGPSVHTRRPIPQDAEYPLIVVGPIAARGEEDGINTFRPIVMLDLIAYGEQDHHYRDVEEVAEALYHLFHRQRAAITVTDYHVVSLLCTGPIPAPVDDDSRVGRRVSLTARLFASQI